MSGGLPSCPVLPPTSPADCHPRVGNVGPPSLSRCVDFLQALLSRARGPCGEAGRGHSPVLRSQRGRGGQKARGAARVTVREGKEGWAWGWGHPDPGGGRADVVLCTEVLHVVLQRHEVLRLKGVWDL